MQIKKHIALTLAFFLMISNSGLAFNVHYCGEKIASITSVFSKDEVCVMPSQNDEDLCCAKKEITHKKCCSDKEVNLKNKSEKFTYKTVSFNFDLFHFTSAPKLTFSNVITDVIVTQNTSYFCRANAPPLYQLYCQFTLFG